MSAGDRHRFFALKAALGAAGLAVGVAGMALARRWLVWTAVTLLLMAFALRFVERRARGDDAP